MEKVEVQESLEGVELHPAADEKAQTGEELFLYSDFETPEIN